MHPEQLSSLAAQQRRDVETAMTAHRAPKTSAARRVRPLSLPRYRVTWTRAILPTVAGHRRGRSLVIVISATRTL